MIVADGALPKWGLCFDFLWILLRALISSNVVNGSFFGGGGWGTLLGLYIFFILLLLLFLFLVISGFGLWRVMSIPRVKRGIQNTHISQQQSC